MIDDINNIVQEWNIVRNQDKGILIVLEIAFEPVNVFGIQVVVARPATRYQAFQGGV